MQQYQRHPLSFSYIFGVKLLLICYFQTAFGRIQRLFCWVHEQQREKVGDPATAVHVYKCMFTGICHVMHKSSAKLFHVNCALSSSPDSLEPKHRAQSYIQKWKKKNIWIINLLRIRYFIPPYHRLFILELHSKHVQQYMYNTAHYYILKDAIILF